MLGSIQTLGSIVSISAEKYNNLYFMDVDVKRTLKS